jgi:hypothetical protein
MYEYGAESKIARSLESIDQTLKLMLAEMRIKQASQEQDTRTIAEAVGKEIKRREREEWIEEINSLGMTE